MSAHRAAPTQPLSGNEWRVLPLLLPYLWEYRGRVAAALAFLVAAKLANVAVPLVLKEVVDGLDVERAMLVVPAALLAIYGLLRFSTVLFAELRDLVFVRVTQRAIRRVALGVFRHLHALSLRFHLERQTGGMSRDIERGTKGISTLLSYLLFSILPVILEFALVAAVLLGKFDWRFAAITFGAVAFYIGFTVIVTEWRMHFRRRANELDSRANTRAIDSLLNYETVKYFGNEAHEATRFDAAMQRYERAAVLNQTSLSALNVGQAAIISIGVTVVLTSTPYSPRDRYCLRSSCSERSSSARSKMRPSARPTSRRDFTTWSLSNSLTPASSTAATAGRSSTTTTSTSPSTSSFTSLKSPLAYRARIACEPRSGSKRSPTRTGR